ncbi:bifunctional deaminase-reductase-like protein [Streptomyces lincolnensis]|uniref:Bifunctional deaminase-reductase-like protein n=1 Tax=Streptomyces lincolnensis TaxID=1915 RepID=A0A1B1MPT3_STRLN|nr:dihydrofolate reductase family protein [Streptomyces lincolnensis]ANS70619.1 bifunctional deaminase-reductase-like protein [Streptomyces lincolnensis]
MGKVIYWMNASMDGYIEDSKGGMDFMDPAEDFRQAANDHVRRISAFLFGRRLYEAMEKPWTQDLGKEGAPALEREFAQLYKETPRYVFSDTVQTVPDGVTIVRRKDAVSAVTRLKEEIDGTLQLGGPELAVSLLDLIDEFWVYTLPVIIGGGKPYLPVGEKLRLHLVEHRSLASGIMFARYVRS